MERNFLLLLLGVCYVAGMRENGVTRFQKKTIINLHNKFRRDLTSFMQPPAADMQKMYWDPALEKKAQKWASECSMEEDSPANRAIAGKFQVAQTVTGSKGQVMTWRTVITAWHDQGELFEFGKRQTVNEHTLPYTTMVAADTARVGCGFAVCRNKGIWQNFVCNYGPESSRPSEKPYTRGRQAADCPASRNEGLCDCQGKVCLNGATLNVNTCMCSEAPAQPDETTVVSAEITRPGQMTTTKPVTSSEGESAPATVPGQETTTAPKTSPEYANTTVAGQEVTTKGEEAQTTAATDSSTEPSSSEEPSGAEQLITSLHNDVRRGLQGFGQPAAANMQKLYWDSELAARSQAWANKCVYKHTTDTVITGKYEVMENLRWSTSGNDGSADWKETVEKWKSEEERFQHGVGSTGGVVSHYTAIIVASASKVGCGYAKCPGPVPGRGRPLMMDWHYYVCQYAPNPKDQRTAPYKKGSQGSDCATNDNGLCDCKGKVCFDDKTLTASCECE